MKRNREKKNFKEIIKGGIFLSKKWDRLFILIVLRNILWYKQFGDKLEIGIEKIKEKK